MTASIDIVLDQHAGTVRADAGAPAALELLAGTQALLRAAAADEIAVRLVLPAPHDAAAARAAQELLTAPATVIAGDDGLAAPAGAGPHVLVAADRVVRRAAADGGFAPVAHPALALAVARGEPLRFARLSGAIDALRDEPGLVPYWVERPAGEPPWAFALLAPAALARALDDRAIGVDCLALDHAVEDPLIVQLDPGAQAGAALSAYTVLWADGDRVLLAVDAATANDAIPAHGAHGHFRFLTPDPLLLAAPVVVAAGASRLLAAAEPVPLTADEYAATVGRYAGLAALDARGAIRSRHSSHPDNERAVDALLAELTALGYAPATHGFAFGGRILRNVVADMPGTGELGADAGLVVLGCHLDSTAARDPGYLPLRDPARGADDDASGMAALLAIARHLPQIRDQLWHTVRLGFFNAEESGLVGSRAYAASLKAAGAPIVGVVCCDMIAFNGDARRSWEVHAGFTDPAVRDLSVPLAQRVAAAAAGLGVLPPAQVYSGTRSSGGTDPTRVDGAINRSDHASFQEQGYPAVLVSEDFFPNRPGEPAEDPNPNYHRNSDAVIDAQYATDITRAVSVAVIELAAQSSATPPG